MSEEAVIDMDGLEASLDDLLKAADASDVRDRLAKAVRGEHPGSSGVSVAHSGRVDEDGQGGGGLADMGDAGGIDDLMIGKMIDAGIAAGTVADFVAYMKGKQEEDEDEEEMDGYYGKSDPSQGKGGEPLRKSHAQEWSEDPDISEAVDASPFMEALTMRTTQALDQLHKSMMEGQFRQNDFNGKMAKAVGSLGKLVKSQSQVIDELRKRLGIVERTPMPQKGTTTTTGLTKSIPGGAQQGDAPKPLTKSEAVATLTYMNLKKGIKQINGHKTAELACMLEAGGSIDKGTIEEIQRFLVVHPNEAKLAKAYQ